MRSQVDAQISESRGSVSEKAVPAIGFITIGQSPREDMIPEMSHWFGPVRVLERGALDGMTMTEISALSPAPGDYPLATRLRDGSSVTVAKRPLLPLVQIAVTELEDEGADAIVIVCTGEFPVFQHRVPLLTAERLFVDGARAIARGSRVGVICPLPDQKALTREKWATLGEEPQVTVGSPYDDNLENLRAAAQGLGRAGVEYVLMDCMGYTQKMKELVVAESDTPTILARSVVARLTAEVV